MYLYFPQKVPQNIGQMPAMRRGMEETRSGTERHKYISRNLLSLFNDKSHSFTIQSIESKTTIHNTCSVGAVLNYKRLCLSVRP